MSTSKHVDILCIAILFSLKGVVNMNEMDILEKFEKSGEISIPIRDVDTQFLIEDTLKDHNIPYHKIFKGNRYKKSLVIISDQEEKGNRL